MEFDRDKVDEMTLALLWLVSHEDRNGTTSAWKSFDWGTMDRLYEKGYISDPKRKTKSVAVSPEGASKAEELFKKHFGV
ncbi:MAG TPA: hypothetical protein DDW96_02705 [Synergistaceae bacterium]|nr:hypothetical protein [Synergistaceae bacterium]HCP08014.1 hypothetical protein [Synergistaceae bacterium]